ncbi:MAG: TfuA-related McrA-glycine thioamidation protein [Methanobacteriaceae archaeon]|nr:TfuA-related McrA-glycine thioamidation protein [Methanobacteriaceae archaeon]
MTDNIIIFSGPSISHDKGKNILKAKYLPPVKRGDIQKIINSEDDNPKIIGIIDGVFHQDPAVSHKEILNALDENIMIIGGSSMGALRACELEIYGMIGIGRIFNDYKTGIIESDDDVAVAFDPKTGKLLSEPLINIYYNLEDALKESIITKKDFNELITIGKNIYYPKRSFEYIFKKSNLDSTKLDNLNNYLKNNYYDMKYLDAIKLLEYIKQC